MTEISCFVQYGPIWMILIFCDEIYLKLATTCDIIFMYFIVNISCGKDALSYAYSYK